MDSLRQKLLLFSARGSPRTTRFVMPDCEAEIWSRYRALGALGIWVSSLPGTWDFTLSHSGGGARRNSWRETWARTCTSIPPSRTPGAVLQRMGGARAILATG